MEIEITPEPTEDERAAILAAIEQAEALRQNGHDPLKNDDEE